MLDIQAAAARGAPFPPIELVRIELSPIANGRVHVALTATTVDDEIPELLETEIARDQVATIDDVVALIRAHIRIGANPSKEH